MSYYIVKSLFLVWAHLFTSAYFASERHLLKITLIYFNFYEHKRRGLPFNSFMVSFCCLSSWVRLAYLYLCQCASVNVFGTVTASYCIKEDIPAFSLSTLSHLLLLPSFCVNFSFCGYFDRLLLLLLVATTPQLGCHYCKWPFDILCHLYYR